MSSNKIDNQDTTTTAIAVSGWTKELLIKAGKKYYEAYGEVPTMVHFYPTAASKSKRADKDILIKRFIDDDCWPSSSTIIKHFKSFGAYQKACGFEPTRSPRSSSSAVAKIERMLAFNKPS